MSLEPRRRLLVIVLVLVLVAAGLYLGSLLNGFVYDDVAQVLGNPWIRDVRHLPDIFTHHVWAFTDKDSDYYRPLMHSAYAVSYMAFGPSPAAFHALSLVLHVATTLGVFVLIRRLVPVPQASAFPLPAFLATLVFAAHPIHVEAVAWIGGLPDLACGAFSVAGLCACVAAWNPGARTFLLHGAGAVCFLIAALFKEPGLAFPAVVVALDVAHRPAHRGVAFWSGRYGALAACGIVYAALRLNALGGVALRASGGAGDLAQALELAGAALWRYVAMLVLPHPLNAYQTLETATGLPSWIALLGFPVAALVALWRRSVAFGAALAIFLLPLLPALLAPALLPGLDNPWAERYTYLPSVGFAVALALGVSALTRAHPAGSRVAVALALAVLLPCSALTIARIPVWHDDLTLWRDTTAKSPTAGAAHGALGYALFVRGDIEQAIAEYETGIRLDPDHADSWLNLGVALARKGEHDAALARYAEAMRLQPRRAIVRADMAISLSMLGQHAEAIDTARRAVELGPGLAKAHHALGVALGNAGRVAEAAAEFRRALELDPADAHSRKNLESAERWLAGPQRPPKK